MPEEGCLVVGSISTPAQTPNLPDRNRLVSPDNVVYCSKYLRMGN
jgi:hypothetical protein